LQAKQNSFPFFKIIYHRPQNTSGYEVLDVYNVFFNYLTTFTQTRTYLLN